MRVALVGAALWLGVCPAAPAGALSPDPAHIRLLLDRGFFDQAEREATTLAAGLDLGEVSGSLADDQVLDLLVEAKVRNGKSAEASTRTLAERALRLTESRAGGQSAAVAVPLHNLAAIHLELGEPALAHALHRRALALRERQVPRVDRDVAASLEQVAFVEILLERFASARERLDRALSLRQGRHDSSSLALAHTLELQALLHRYSGEYKAGLALMDRVLAIRTHEVPEQPQQASSLGLRGELLFLDRDLTAARRAWADGLTVADDTLDPQHPLRAILLRELALVTDALGDRAASRDLLARAVEIGRQRLAPCNPDVAGLLNDSALSKKRDGDFAKAKILYQEQLRTLERCHANANWRATALHNMGSLAYEMGDLAEAVRLHERAIEVWSAGLGPRHPYVARGLDALADVVAARGDFARARTLYERALAILRRRKATSPDVAWTLSNLARIIAKQGQIALALRYVQDAVAAYRRAGAFEDPDHLARSLQLQGELQARQGDFTAAHTSLSAAIAERARVFGAAHPLVAESRAVLARVEFDEGDVAGAARDALEAEGSGRDHLRFVVRYLPERQALTYAAKRPQGLDLALSAASQGVAAAPVLDALIRSRGVILDELAWRAHTPIAADAESESRRVAATQARQRYANLLVRSLQDAVPRGVLDDARRQKEDAETALAEQSADARAELRHAQLGLEDIRQALPTDAVLLSFVKYERHAAAGARRETMYGAFVLRGGTTDVVFVSIGPASPLDALIRSWRSEAAGDALTAGISARAAQRRYLDVATRLRGRVWDPLAPHLAGATRVFIVPDGLLSIVNFDALPDENGRYLVEGTAVLHYLSTERDLMAPAGAASPQGLLAVGGASFGQASGGIASGTRGVGCQDLGRIRFENLPGSRREVDEISRMWTAMRPHDAVVLSGAAATETAVKHALAHQRVVHLATHGFFLGGSCDSTPLPLRGTRGVGGLALASPRRPKPTTTDNPLRLAGLAFAGANRHPARIGSDDDGILTAEEIASLDLQGTEWAVLSACDTGLGEITNGEGVIGLRRAFQIAGARTVIMSLWAVEDGATADWMRALYDARFSKSADTARAVHDASGTVLQARRDKGQSTHPFFWAGFVAVGDWR